MALQLKVGLDIITSYRRLAYTPWHALAEFVDNSTQAYFNHRGVLHAAYGSEGTRLTVGIVYEPAANYIRISDNSMGMNYEELEHALHIAQPPKDSSGRSKYGLGMKTAACWLGNVWTVRTKKLGETIEHVVQIDVEQVANGNNEIPYKQIEGKRATDHYTVIEISYLNRKFKGRTLHKIREFLKSMYREDFRNGDLILEWQGVGLSWEEPKLLFARDGSEYRREFEFLVDGKRVWGWVGILERGSRADAGFSIIHCGRVVRGYPDSWRPSTIYGQLQGSNDLVNQRLVGEVHLDSFDVSHTKDDILWLGDQEDEVETKLLEKASDFREMARDYRKSSDEGRGPTPADTEVAIEEIRRELESPEMVDAVSFLAVPPAQVVDQSFKMLAETITQREETFRAKIASLSVVVYLVIMSPNDPYIILDTAKESEVVIVCNTAHPHWLVLKGADGILNYLRHCVYDGISEWQAMHRVGRIDPNTVKLLKDRLLRVPLEIEGSAMER